MIRRNTWIVLVLLVGLLSFAVYFNNRKALKAIENTPTPQAAFLFTSEEGQISSLRVVASSGGVVELARDQQGVWVLKAPVDAAADQGLAEAAASQVATLRVLDEVDLALEAVGLDRPAYFLTLRFTGGMVHKLNIGSLTPSQSGYYVRVDGKRTVILSAPGVDSLVTIVAFPPYLSTPTPFTIPATETLVPVTEAVPTATP
jgi:hypothetical protein